MSLLALMLCTFAIGTTEFITMGILPEVSRDLHVSISAAGLLVTGYAIGVAIGAPLLTAITGRVERKRLLLGLMLMFVIGNVLCALAPTYAVLLVARFVAAFAHGTFFGAGAVVASKIVPVQKQASAVAMIFTGVSVANIVGVPLGTFVGQQLGWRASFWSVGGLGLLGTLAVALWVPRITVQAKSQLRQELHVMKSAQVQLTLVMTVLSFVGIFAAFTYVAPLLMEITGFSAEQITPILLLYGVGLTIGNTFAGKLANRRIMPTAIGGLALSALAMGLLYYTIHVKWAAVLTILLWGLASFGHVPALQMRIIEKAKEAPNLASSLNISAFNLGIALGSALGAWVIHSGFGLTAVPIAATALTMAAIIVALYGWRKDTVVNEVAKAA